MKTLSREVQDFLERRLDRGSVSACDRPAYRKWVCFYLDFCGKYGHPPRAVSSIEPFLAKLASKRQTEEQIGQASAAIGLLLARPADVSGRARAISKDQPRLQEKMSGQGTAVAAERDGQASPRWSKGMALAPWDSDVPVRTMSAESGGAGRSRTDESSAVVNRTDWAASGETAPAERHPGASWEGDYQELEGAIKMRNYSKRTFEVYRLWVRKFQAFVRSKATLDLDTEDVKAFLTDLAVCREVAASTQNQAFNALLFF